MFEDYPRETCIKDGTFVLLRPVAQNDRAELKRFFSRIPEDERWFLRDDLADEQVMDGWLDNVDFDRILPMVAVAHPSNQIVANVRLYRRPPRSMRHIAHLRINVDPSHRHQRLGTWMLIDIIKLAMDIGLEKLVAEFVAGVEDAARTAAHKLDFFEQAVLSDYVKDPEGNYRDLVIMVKNLHRDWSDF
jgi:L-amino acid N-acyltransferase YncA